MMTTETTPEAAFANWEAGTISAREAATAIAQELIAEIEPQEHALQTRKKALREALGTVLIHVGEPLTVENRVARWVEPTFGETVSVKRLRRLCHDLHNEDHPALTAVAARIEACITLSERRGYPLIEPPPKERRGA
jgi:hypothetical protein